MIWYQEAAIAASAAVMEAHNAGTAPVFRDKRYALVLNPMIPDYRGAKCSRCHLTVAATGHGLQGNLNKHWGRQKCKNAAAE